MRVGDGELLTHSKTHLHCHPHRQIGLEGAAAQCIFITFDITYNRLCWNTFWCVCYAKYLFRNIYIIIGIHFDTQFTHKYTWIYAKLAMVCVSHVHRQNISHTNIDTCHIHTHTHTHPFLLCLYTSLFLLGSISSFLNQTWFSFPDREGWLQITNSSCVVRTPCPYTDNSPGVLSELCTLCWPAPDSALIAHLYLWQAVTANIARR